MIRAGRMASLFAFGAKVALTEAQKSVKASAAAYSHVRSPLPPAERLRGSQHRCSGLAPVDTINAFSAKLSPSELGCPKPVPEGSKGERTPRPCNRTSATLRFVIVAPLTRARSAASSYSPARIAITERHRLLRLHHAVLLDRLAKVLQAALTRRRRIALAVSAACAMVTLRLHGSDRQERASTMRLAKPLLMRRVRVPARPTFAFAVIDWARSDT